MFEKLPKIVGFVQNCAAQITSTEADDIAEKDLYLSIYSKVNDARRT
tara:strand:- start:1098 stop:1238 length:141 start_codon:yes stop_codon:yes gene_type:complete